VSISCVEPDTCLLTVVVLRSLTRAPRYHISLMLLVHVPNGGNVPLNGTRDSLAPRERSRAGRR